MQSQPSGQRGTERAAMLVALPAAFLTPFMGSAANVALPAIGRTWDMSAVELSWVSTAYLLAAAAFLLPFGRLADIVGRKRVLGAGLFLYAIASFLSAAAPSSGALIVFRVVQGVAASMTFATNLAILTSVFPTERRGAALGSNVAATYLGLSLGPLVAGLLTEAASWRAVFALGAVVALFSLLVLATLLRGEWADARGERFDVLGSLILAVALASTMYGVSLLPRGDGVALALGGLLGLFGFGAWESRAVRPVLDLRLVLRNRTFAFSNLAALIHYAATSAVSFFLSLYLQVMRGLRPDAAGLVLLTQPLVQVLFSPLAGKLSDRLEPRFLASGGMGLTVLALATLSLLGPGTGMGLIILALLALGLGFAFFSAPNTNAVMSSVRRSLFGIASATLGTMRLVGNTLSMAVAVLLLAARMGNAPLTAEHMEDFLRCTRTGFPLFAALCAVGVWASLSRGTPQDSAPEGSEGSSPREEERRPDASGIRRIE